MITPTLSTALRSAAHRSNRTSAPPGRRRCQYCGTEPTVIVIWRHVDESSFIERRTPTCAAHVGWLDNCAVVVRVEVMG